MNCERCGRRRAVIRWRDPEDLGGEPLQLCADCAAALRVARGEQAADERQPEPLDGLILGGLGAPGEETCPACAWTAARFRRTNRLGCPHCYAAFRSILLPILGRYHRHVSHLGKRPVHGGGEPSRLSEITRTRVALEKAIAREEFETAAALRDRIRELEAQPPPREQS
jgi:protein arginine kinase activator